MALKAEIPDYLKMSEGEKSLYFARLEFLEENHTDNAWVACVELKCQVCRAGMINEQVFRIPLEKALNNMEYLRLAAM